MAAVRVFEVGRILAPSIVETWSVLVYNRQLKIILSWHVVRCHRMYIPLIWMLSLRKNLR